MDMITWVHATIWEPGDSGEATTARHRAAEAGVAPVPGGCQGWQFGELSVSVAASLSPARLAGAEIQAGTRPSLQADTRPKAGVDPDSSRRAAELRLCHGPVDLEARGPRDRGALWHLLPLQSHVALPSRLGVERAEACEAGPGSGTSRRS